MRKRMIFAALLAGAATSPALAQQADATPGTTHEEHRGHGDGGGWRGRGGGDAASPAAPTPSERPQRNWSQPQVQAQNPVPQERDARSWSGQRVDDGSWQRRWQHHDGPGVQTQTAPVAPPVAHGQAQDGNRNWRGNGQSWNSGGNWNRNDARTAPPVVRNEQRNWRDRDGDGVRNNRDWDRNNDGHVDRRWDRNGNGTVDRRYDGNRDGVRDSRWNGNRNWNDGQSWHNSQSWNREWRNDRRYDWQRYRYSNRDLYRLPRYYSPYGYGRGYERFGIGIYLDSGLFASRYRISDPGRYRLPNADWPYEWVRYYDDVLLVDTRNGYVVDVIYDFFWQ